MTLSSTLSGVEPHPSTSRARSAGFPRVGTAAVDFGSLGSTIWCPQPCAGAGRGGYVGHCLVYLVEKGMSAMTKREADA
jgi:hypothetical protein